MLESIVGAETGETWIDCGPDAASELRQVYLIRSLPCFHVWPPPCERRPIVSVNGAAEPSGGTTRSNRGSSTKNQVKSTVSTSGTLTVHSHRSRANSISERCSATYSIFTKRDLFAPVTIASGRIGHLLAPRSPVRWDHQAGGRLLGTFRN